MELTLKVNMQQITDTINEELDKIKELFKDNKMIVSSINEIKETTFDVVSSLDEKILQQKISDIASATIKNAILDRSKEQLFSGMDL